MYSYRDDKVRPLRPVRGRIQLYSDDGRRHWVSLSDVLDGGKGRMSRVAVDDVLACARSRDRAEESVDSSGEGSLMRRTIGAVLTVCLLFALFGYARLSFRLDREMREERENAVPVLRIAYHGGRVYDMDPFGRLLAEAWSLAKSSLAGAFRVADGLWKRRDGWDGMRKYIDGMRG